MATDGNRKRINCSFDAFCCQLLLCYFRCLLLTYLILVSSSFSNSEDVSSLPNLDPDVLKRAQRVISQENLHKRAGGKLDPCQVCKSLSDSFELGLQETERGKFEGGDTYWEETKRLSYKDSELRLVEIQEKLCKSLTTGKEECHRLAEETENIVESWYFNDRKTGINIFSFLCMKMHPVCCPGGTFGPECKPCPGHPDEICSGNGFCKGNGSRLGTGKCSCKSGYAGEVCNRCAPGYFENGLLESSQLPNCTKCDSSCKSHCRHEGPKGCEICADGYFWGHEFGCTDINECYELDENPCSGNTFCINTIGSYQCFQCDKACFGCHGDGPDTCEQCATGYEKKDGVCVNTEKSEQEKRIEMTRYATYFGLGVATCIIFRKNIFIASIIGLLVAIYIGLAEYTVRDHKQNNFLESLLSRELFV